MWVEFVVGSLLAPRVFHRVSGFPPSTKTNISKFQFDLETVNEEPLRRYASANSHLIFIYYLYFPSQKSISCTYLALSTRPCKYLNVPEVICKVTQG